MDFTSLVTKSGYLAFYPARHAVAQGLAEVVASYKPPNFVEVPRRVRRVGARGRKGTPLSWILEDEGEETLRKSLNSAERELPIAAIWNHELLVARISEKWDPQSEGLP
jgi:hypothetical protein